jgi:protein SCO1/2
VDVHPVTRTALCTASLILLLTIGACQRSHPPDEVLRANRPEFGGDFALTTHDGETFRLLDVRGKAVLLFFGYTSCPDMCPVTMSRIMSALDRLGDDASQVVTLFVSVDPQRDTPAVLKEYVTSFRTPLIGLTGTDDQLASVAAKYRASYEVVPSDSPNYLVNHTTAIFLIDRQGKLRDYFAFDEDPGALAQALNAVLDE